MNIQEYINQLRHTYPDQGKPMVSKKPTIRFREANSLSNSSNERQTQKKNGPLGEYESVESFNSDLGKAFDLIASGKWEESDIPYRLRVLNVSTAKRLIDLGVEEKIAKLLAILMVVECPVCIRYIGINTKEVNASHVFLVPHFLLGSYLRPSKKVAHCPVFIALDGIERSKAQVTLDLCPACTQPVGQRHLCNGNIVACARNDKLNKMFCSCHDCTGSLNYQRSKCVEAQKKYIDSNGQRILLNGGHTANHIADVDNKVEKHVDSQEVASLNYANLQLSSIEELKATVKLDTSTQFRSSRFSIIFIKCNNGFEIPLIWDTGASTSTMM